MAEQTYKISRANKNIYEFISIGNKRLSKQVSFDELEAGSGTYNLS
jgi:hypothetical protein